jgi:hypothetical protein
MVHGSWHRIVDPFINTAQKEDAGEVITLVKDPA